MENVIEFGATVSKKALWEHAVDESISWTVNSYVNERDYENLIRFNITVSDMSDREVTQFYWLAKNGAIWDQVEEATFKAIANFVGCHLVGQVVEQTPPPVPAEKPKKKTTIKKTAAKKEEPKKEVKKEEPKKEVKKEEPKKEVKKEEPKKEVKKEVKKEEPKKEVKGKGVPYSKVNGAHVKQLTIVLDEFGIDWREDVIKAKELSYSLDGQPFFNEKGEIELSFGLLVKKEYGLD